MSPKQKSCAVPDRCCFCGSNEDSELDWGKLYILGDITVHYFCLLFSSGLPQNGDDNEGILGFLQDDIAREIQRGRKLSCSYCLKKGATIGCVEKKCKRKYHYPCGTRNYAICKFTNDYRSYCSQHRQFQDGVGLNEEKECPICLDILRADPKRAVWAPCCRRDSWFHKRCLQMLALSAGYFFKCPLCNDTETFLPEMKNQGIYVPEKDASWELEPNAYGELLERPIHCDAERCRCPKGRKADVDGTWWEVLLCNLCGSTGVHVRCGGLPFSVTEWSCPSCSHMLEESVQRLQEEVRRRASAAVEAGSSSCSPSHVTLEEEALDLPKEAVLTMPHQTEGCTGGDVIGDIGCRGDEGTAGSPCKRKLLRVCEERPAKLPHHEAPPCTPHHQDDPPHSLPPHTILRELEEMGEELPPALERLKEEVQKAQARMVELRLTEGEVVRAARATPHHPAAPLDMAHLLRFFRCSLPLDKMEQVLGLLGEVFAWREAQVAQAVAQTSGAKKRAASCEPRGRGKRRSLGREEGLTSIKAALTRTTTASPSTPSTPNTPHTPQSHLQEGDASHAGPYSPPPSEENNNAKSPPEEQQQKGACRKLLLHGSPPPTPAQGATDTTLVATTADRSCAGGDLLMTPLGVKQPPAPGATGDLVLEALGMNKPIVPSLHDSGGIKTSSYSIFASPERATKGSSEATTATRSPIFKNQEAMTGQRDPIFGHSELTAGDTSVFITPETQQSSPAEAAPSDPIFGHPNRTTVSYPSIRNSVSVVLPCPGGKPSMPRKQRKRRYLLPDTSGRQLTLFQVIQKFHLKQVEKKATAQCTVKLKQETADQGTGTASEKGTIKGTAAQCNIKQEAADQDTDDGDEAAQGDVSRDAADPGCAEAETVVHDHPEAEATDSSNPGAETAWLGNVNSCVIAKKRAADEEDRSAQAADPHMTRHTRGAETAAQDGPRETRAPVTALSGEELSSLLLRLEAEERFLHSTTPCLWGRYRVQAAEESQEGGEEMDSASPSRPQESVPEGCQECVVVAERLPCLRRVRGIHMETSTILKVHTTKSRYHYVYLRSASLLRKCYLEARRGTMNPSRS